MNFPHKSPANQRLQRTTKCRASISKQTRKIRAAKMRPPPLPAAGERRRAPMRQRLESSHGFSGSPPRRASTIPLASICRRSQRRGGRARRQCPGWGGNGGPHKWWTVIGWSCFQYVVMWTEIILTCQRAAHRGKAKR